MFSMDYIISSGNILENVKNQEEQAGAELGQAQLKLRLDFN